MNPKIGVILAVFFILSTAVFAAPTAQEVDAFLSDVGASGVQAEAIRGNIAKLNSIESQTLAMEGVVAPENKVTWSSSAVEQQVTELKASIEELRVLRRQISVEYKTADPASLDLTRLKQARRNLVSQKNRMIKASALNRESLVVARTNSSEAKSLSAQISESRAALARGVLAEHQTAAAAFFERNYLPLSERLTAQSSRFNLIETTERQIAQIIAERVEAQALIEEARATIKEADAILGSAKPPAEQAQKVSRAKEATAAASKAAARAQAASAATERLVSEAEKGIAESLGREMGAVNSRIAELDGKIGQLTASVDDLKKMVSAVSVQTPTEKVVLTVTGNDNVIAVSGEGNIEQKVNAKPAESVAPKETVASQSELEKLIEESPKGAAPEGTKQPPVIEPASDDVVKSPELKLVDEPIGPAAPEGESRLSQVRSKLLQLKPAMKIAGGFIGIYIATLLLDSAVGYGLESKLPKTNDYWAPTILNNEKASLTSDYAKKYNAEIGGNVGKSQSGQILLYKDPYPEFRNFTAKDVNGRTFYYEIYPNAHRNIFAVRDAFRDSVAHEETGWKYFNGLLIGIGAGRSVSEKYDMASFQYEAEDPGLVKAVYIVVFPIDSSGVTNPKPIKFLSETLLDKLAGQYDYFDSAVQCSKSAANGIKWYCDLYGVRAGLQSGKYVAATFVLMDAQIFTSHDTIVPKMQETLKLRNCNFAVIDGSKDYCPLFSAIVEESYIDNDIEAGKAQALDDKTVGKAFIEPIKSAVAEQGRALAEVVQKVKSYSNPVSILWSWLKYQVHGIPVIFSPISGAENVWNMGKARDEIEKRFSIISNSSNNLGKRAMMVGLPMFEEFEIAGEIRPPVTIQDTKVTPGIPAGNQYALISQALAAIDIKLAREVLGKVDTAGSQATAAPLAPAAGTAPATAGTDPDSIGPGLPVEIPPAVTGEQLEERQPSAAPHAPAGPAKPFPPFAPPSRPEPSAPATGASAPAPQPGPSPASGTPEIIATVADDSLTEDKASASSFGPGSAPDFIKSTLNDWKINIELNLPSPKRLNFININSAGGWSTINRENWPLVVYYNGKQRNGSPPNYQQSLGLDLPAGKSVLTLYIQNNSPIEMDPANNKKFYSFLFGPVYLGFEDGSFAAFFDTKKIYESNIPPQGAAAPPSAQPASTPTPQLFDNLSGFEIKYKYPYKGMTPTSLDDPKSGFFGINPAGKVLRPGEVLVIFAATNISGKAQTYDLAALEVMEGYRVRVWIANYNPANTNKWISQGTFKNDNWWISGKVKYGPIVSTSEQDGDGIEFHDYAPTPEGVEMFEKVRKEFEAQAAAGK